MTLGLGKPSVSFQLKKNPKPKSPNLSTLNIFQNISPQNVIRKKKIKQFYDDQERQSLHLCNLFIQNPSKVLSRFQM